MQAAEMFDQSIQQLAVLDENLARVKVDLAGLDNLDLGLIESNMDCADVVLALTYGVLGGIFATNESVKQFMEQVHADASNPNGSHTTLGKLLRHYKDNIDSVEVEGVRTFLDRNGHKAGYLHRVFRGHDPFSLHKDNPFLVLSQQYGVFRGVLQVFRHLTADTFSKQGLPIPFHSFFDFEKPNGKMGNWLIELADQTRKATGTDLQTQQVFSSLFTIHMQDILAMGLTWGLTWAHIKVRKIDDKVRAGQIRIVAYATTFFTQVVVGMAKTGGVPYINWPTLSLLLKEIYAFLKLNWEEIRELERVTAALTERNIALEQAVFAVGAELPTLSSGQDYVSEMMRGARNIKSLTSLFGEEE